MASVLEPCEGSRHFKENRCKTTKLSRINTGIFYVFYTVKVLVTFQSYFDSRPWLWTSDFDCWRMPIIAYRLLLADFTMIFDMI